MNNYSKALEFCLENGIVLEEYEIEQLHCIYEGANIDSIKAFNRAKKEYEKYSKAANKAINDLDYKTAKENVEKMKEVVADIEKEFNDIDSTALSSRVFGFIATLLINMLSSIVPSIGSFAGSVGVAAGVKHGANKVAEKAANRAAKGPYVGDVMNKTMTTARKVSKGADKFNATIKDVNVKLPKGKSKDIAIKGKGALVVAGAVEALSTLKKTVDDYKQMKRDAEANPNADGNLFRAKIQGMFKELKTQIALLERYIDLNSSVKTYDET